MKKQNLYLVFEYVDTDLENMIANKKALTTQAEIKNIMRQILECVQYLHSQSIIHRVAQSLFMLHRILSLVTCLFQKTDVLNAQISELQGHLQNLQRS